MKTLGLLGEMPEFMPKGSRRAWYGRHVTRLKNRVAEFMLGAG